MIVTYIYIFCILNLKHIDCTIGNATLKEVTLKHLHNAWEKLTHTHISQEYRKLHTIIVCHDNCKIVNQKSYTKEVSYIAEQSLCVAGWSESRNAQLWSRYIPTLCTQCHPSSQSCCRTPLIARS